MSFLSSAHSFFGASFAMSGGPGGMGLMTRASSSPRLRQVVVGGVHAVHESRGLVQGMRRADEEVVHATERSLFVRVDAPLPGVAAEGVEAHLVLDPRREVPQEVQSLRWLAQVSHRAQIEKPKNKR
eukprot:scaffold6386_cov114-Isochrysis_galbana.AAC.4